MADGVFLGSTEQMEEYYRNKGKTLPTAGLTVTKNDETGRKNQSPADRLNIETLEPMSDEELYHIKRVRLRNPSDTVYMQSDVEFYDFFYRGGDQIDPLTKAAHQIKRVYMNAEDYFYALDVRDAYIDMVVERDFKGNMYRFNRAMNNGEVYVPPSPFYSKRAIDYDVVMAGGRMEYNTEPDIDVELVSSIIKEWWESVELSPEEMGVADDVVVMPWVLDEIEETSNQSGKIRSSSGRMVMSVTDIKAIQDTLNNIYQNRNPGKQTGNSRLFCKTPIRIREEYNKSFCIALGDLLTDMVHGKYKEEVADDNAMTHDPVSNKPMTVGEYKKRSLIRQMTKLGWSELPLMKAFNVGSAYERRKMDANRANVRKLKKGLAKALEEQDAYAPKVNFSTNGEPDRYFDPMEELSKYFR